LWNWPCGHQPRPPESKDSRSASNAPRQQTQRRTGFLRGQSFVEEWPIGEAERALRLMELLDARVALTPWLALLMTWLDDADTCGTRAGARHHAINHNSFVVAQAETYGKVAVFADVAGNRWDLLGPQ
jgi:hypothetical protein